MPPVPPQSDRNEFMPKKQKIVLSGPYEESPGYPQRLVSLYHQTVRVYTNNEEEFYMLQMPEFGTALDLFQKIMIFVFCLRLGEIKR